MDASSYSIGKHGIMAISNYQISKYQFSLVLIGTSNWEYPWLFTVLRPGPRWRLALRYFRKTKFERSIKQSYKQIPRKRRTLACRCLLVGRKNIFLTLNLQENHKNALDLIPEMPVVNCQQSF